MRLIKSHIGSYEISPETYIKPHNIQHLCDKCVTKLLTNIEKRFTFNQAKLVFNKKTHVYVRE